MPETPNSQLQKALARRADSNSSKPHWRELMDRYDTVPASKAIQAPAVLSGFYGSWAAQFGVAGSDKTQSRGITVPPVQARSSRLGLPGMAEINFRPYDVGTLRKGTHGPSLLGHPISFEVVGPTLRSIDCTFQWQLDATGTQDQLTFDTISAMSTAGLELATPATGLDAVYGLTAIPDEGLYLVISLTGASGKLDDGSGGSVVGGVGDGLYGVDPAAVYPPLIDPRLPITALNEDSKYEIFRVVEISADSTLILDSGKRLADYFTIPGGATTPIIRAVMLVKPAATRMVAVPGVRERVGGEQTFAFVPPAHALNADFMPPRIRWDTNGLFDPITGYVSTDVGLLADYDQAVALPLEVPLNRGRCRLQGINGEVPVVLDTGRMRVYLHPLAPFTAAAAIGHVLHLENAERYLDGQLASAASEGGSFIGEGSVDQLLGHWEIVAQGTAPHNYYDLRMVTQFDPNTGVPFYGDAALLKMATGSIVGEAIWFDFALHPPVSDLWTRTHLPASLLDKARLTNIIDPKWVEHTTKNRSDYTAGHYGTPDKASFATHSSNLGADGSNANPGSLKDLGFRVVFFPAKIVSGGLVPDFDHPIEGNEVVLDPTVLTEQQYLEVDYSSGLVHLSHAPVPGTGCQIAPDVATLATADNPRGEVVFFASCIPFSREPGQMGVGPRVTAGQNQAVIGDFCSTGTVNQKDLYGQRIHWSLTNGQTVTSGIQQEIQLNVLLTPLDLPASGFVDILLGFNTPEGDPGLVNLFRRASTFGYTNVKYVDAGNGWNTTLIGVFGGGVAATTLSPTLVNPMTAVLRRNILTPNTLDGVAGTDYQFDTTYGQASRATTLRFAQADLVKQPDGSLIIEVTDARTDAHEQLFDDLFSSWVLQGGVTTVPGSGHVLSYTGLSVVIAGVRSILPAQQVTVSIPVGPPPKDIYVYIDGSDPKCPVYAQTGTLPLPGINDVLIGEYDYVGPNVTAYTNLTHPLLDIDKRLDVTVGKPTGHAQPAAAHFETLAEAVEYVRLVSTPTNGAFGQYRRIKVIGPTVEQDARLPIGAGINGLIIEGMSLRSDGTSPTSLAEITWNGEKALFDLSGSSNWSLRNLRFRYDGAGTSTIIGNRNLFTVIATAEQILMENVTLVGPAHAMLYCPGGAGTGMLGLTLRNCAAANLTDHAVRFDAGTDVLARVLITGCRFTARKPGAVPPPEIVPLTNYGILHFGSASSQLVTVENTLLLGGDMSIKADGLGPYLFTANHYKDSAQVSILLDASQVTIEHSWLDAVHTNPASGATAHTVKGGIVQVSGTKNATMVAHNKISLALAAPADNAIYLAPSVMGAHITNNRVDRDIVGGAGGHITHNEVALGEIVAPTGNIIEGNRTFVDIGHLTITGPNCLVSNNFIKGTLSASSATYSRFASNWFEGPGPHLVGNSCVFTGDTFGNPAVVSVSGKVQLGDGNRFTNCWLTEGIGDGGSNLQDNHFTNCDIRWNTNDVVVSGDDFSFKGCHFTQESAGLRWEIDGVGTVFCDNSIVIGGTFYFHETTPTARQNYVIADNLILPGAAADTSGGLWVEGDYVSITGNNVSGVEHDSAAPDLYGIRFDGAHSVISNNIIDKGLLIVGTGTGDNTVNGNSVNGSATLSADNSLYVGNTIKVDSVFSGDDCSVLSNKLGTSSIIGTVTLTGEDLSFNDNKVLSPLALGSAAGIVQNMVGNHVYETTTISDLHYIKESTITGNTFVGAVNFSNGGVLSCINGTITGNTFSSTSIFTCQYLDKTTVSGNRFAGNVDFANSVTPVIMGNWVGTLGGAARNLDVTVTDNYVIIGNTVAGSILLDNALGATTTGVVVGNKAKEIAPSTSPTNGAVAVGNKVDNGQNVFGTGPGTASIITNNVSD